MAIRSDGLGLVPLYRWHKPDLRIVVGLGQIHGDVGPPDQIVLAAAIAGIDGNADA